MQASMQARFLTTTRFVAVLPGARSANGPDLPAGLPAAVARMGLRPVISSGCFLAIEAGEDAAVPDASDLVVLDVFPGTAAALRRSGGLAPFDRADPHGFAERHAQFYNLLWASPSGFRLESDTLGLKPFYLAEQAAGTFVASRCADILRLCPDLARPADRRAMYQLFVFKAPLGDRTLHESIRRGSTGGCYAWSPAEGLGASRARRLAAPAVEAGRLHDTAVAALAGLLAASIARRTEGIRDPIRISLSGGFDSRLLAAMASARGLRLEAFTFGRRFHSEVRAAKTIASRLGMPHRVLDYPPDNALRQLRMHLRVMEGMADLGITHIANLLDGSWDDGTPMMHGYLGDAPSGLHLREVPAAAYRSLDQLAAAIVESSARLLPRGDAETVLGQADSADDLRHEIRLGLHSDCEPHQAYVLWDIENRQRRFIGGFFPIMGQVLHGIAPYYDRELLEFWLSMPPIALDDRAFLRRFLATTFPDLAAIRHPEEALPVRPSLRHQVKEALSDLPRGALRAAIGRRRMNDLFIRWNRSRTIWSLGNLLAPESQARMLARSLDSLPAIEAILGIRVGRSFATVLERNQQALRNFFLLAEYAHWLGADVLPSHPSGDRRAETSCI